MIQDHEVARSPIGFGFQPPPFGRVVEERAVARAAVDEDDRVAGRRLGGAVEHGHEQADISGLRRIPTFGDDDIAACGRLARRHPEPAQRGLEPGKRGGGPCCQRRNGSQDKPTEPGHRISPDGTPKTVRANRLSVAGSSRPLYENPRLDPVDLVPWCQSYPIAPNTPCGEAPRKRIQRIATAILGRHGGHRWGDPAPFPDQPLDNGMTGARVLVFRSLV